MIDIKQEALLAQEDGHTRVEEKVAENTDGIDIQTAEKQNAEDVEDEVEDETADSSSAHLSSIATAPDNDITHTRAQIASVLHTGLTRTSTTPFTRERFDVEQVIEAEKFKSVAIAPTKTSDGTILVDWYTTDDPANPQNWAASTKGWVLLQLCLYSLSVYGSSSMYVPGEAGIMEQFNIGATPAAIGLAIFVLGYGIGPLLFAPLSEIASIGRNWVYVPTFTIFVILSIPTALVDNYAGLLVLRFLTGFFGSPCLANGGASVGDMVCYIHDQTGCTPLTSGSILFWSSRSTYRHGQQPVSGVRPSVRSCPPLPCKPKIGTGAFG